MEGKYPVPIAMSLDLLTPNKVLSSTTQLEVHDPVNTIKRINEFSCTIAKLKILIGNSLDESSKQITYFKKFLKAGTLTGNGKYICQDVNLQN